MNIKERLEKLRERFGGLSHDEFCENKENGGCDCFSGYAYALLNSIIAEMDKQEIAPTTKALEVAQEIFSVAKYPVLVGTQRDEAIWRAEKIIKDAYTTPRQQAVEPIGYGVKNPNKSYLAQEFYYKKRHAEKSISVQRDGYVVVPLYTEPQPDNKELLRECRELLDDNILLGDNAKHCYGDYEKIVERISQELGE